VDATRRCWDCGDYLGAGRLLYENLRFEERPGWAAAALTEVHDVAGVVAQIEDVIVLADTPDRWREAMAAFHALRQLTLAEDGDEGRDPMRLAILLLAENVAKVTYNASGYPAPYDHDAGWWVVPCLAGVLAAMNATPVVLEHAWAALTSFGDAPIVRRGAPFPRVCYLACELTQDARRIFHSEGPFPSEEEAQRMLATWRSWGRNHPTAICLVPVVDTAAEWEQMRH
jgi:hypothetical protein